MLNGGQTAGVSGKSENRGSIETARAMLSLWPVGEVIGIRHVPTGLMHRTFEVETSGGLFALQRLHYLLSSDEIIEDYFRVTSHLAAIDFPAPRPIRTVTSELSARDDEGYRWRLITWLPGTSFDTIRDAGMVFEAARLLGRFHAAMSDFSHDFRSPHPLHATRYHLEALRQAAAVNRETETFEPTLHQMIDRVLPQLEQSMLPPLPAHVVHGDPKISNFLFDDTLSTTAVIDCDTCTRHTLLVDLGDAARSWCRDGAEDVPTPFRLDYFEAMLEGYRDSPMKLSPLEVACLHRAPRMITLELTSRFLRDVLEDCYFGWDSARYSSRRHHNDARARAMLALADDMADKETRTASLVGRVFAV